MFWPRRGCQRLKQNNVSQNCLVHRRDSYARQSVPETIRETAVPRTAECEKGAADRAETDRWMVWLSTDSRYSKAAVALCAYQKRILVQKRVPCRWTVSFPDENVFTTDGKGICRTSWRKSIMRCPRRLRVPSLNKIAQTVRDRPHFMGISRSELFPGFNRCLAKWKSPLIRSFEPEPDHRHSA